MSRGKRPPPSSSGIEGTFGLDARCVHCQAEREPEGRKLMSLDGTYIVEAPNACSCGERRVKVSFSLGIL